MDKDKQLAIKQGGLTRDQIDLLKRTVARGATDDEFALFIHQCNRTGLDPFSRQIHFVKRWDSKLQRESAVIQTGIDGYRAVADRTARYAGSDDYRFDEGISEYEHIHQARGLPKTATVTVYKVVGNIRCPFTATVRWEEYFPGEKQGFMWNKMPYLMLGKCAESLALRKAFPQELSGLYTKEEMDSAGEIIEVSPSTTNAQVETTATVTVEGHPVDTSTGEVKEKSIPPKAPVAPKPITDSQKTMLFKLYKELWGGTEAEIDEALKTVFVTKFKHPAEEATTAEASSVINEMLAKIKEKKGESK